MLSVQLPLQQSGSEYVPGFWPNSLQPGLMKPDGMQVHIPPLQGSQPPQSALEEHGEPIPGLAPVLLALLAAVLVVVVLVLPEHVHSPSVPSG